MTTVAYVGNFSRPWCTEVHVAGSLEQLGHKVIRLQENTTRWATVPAKVARHRADVLLWTRTWDVDRPACLAALEQLRAAGVPSAFYHLDRWWGLDREYQVATEPFFRMDVVFSPDGGNDDRWLEAGVNHRWLPPGVFAAECGIGRIDRQRFPHDVVFVGSHPYPHGEWKPYRDQLIATMQERFGERFRVWAPAAEGKQLRGRDLADLYTSAKVVVGDSCLIGNPARYWSDRIPETLGRGGVLLHPEVEGLDEWYEHGRDLVTYPVGDFDAAVRQVEHLLEHDELRERIRGQGQATVMERDTYAHRMTSVLEVLAGMVPEKPAPSAKPVEAHHPRSRARASFVLAQGDTDAVAVREVWQNDDYKLTPPDVRGKHVLDIGANVGAFSVLAARMGAKSVHAYEPHPANAAALRLNVERNRVAVDVVEAAVVGAGAGEPDYRVEGDGGGARIVRGGDGPAVKAVSIIEAVSVCAGTVGTLGLLKIDCEGGEYEIFGTEWDAGELEAWLPRVERIVMEFHGPAMPHLTDVLTDGAYPPRDLHQYRRWGVMVAMLADYGRVETFGHPRAGGLLWWRRY